MPGSAECIAEWLFLPKSAVSLRQEVNRGFFRSL
jgi:hypothetical protein